MFCIKCGKNADDSLRYCIHCGADLKEAMENKVGGSGEEVDLESKKIQQRKRETRAIINTVVIVFICVFVYLFYISPKFLGIQILPVDPFGVMDNKDFNSGIGEDNTDSGNRGRVVDNDDKEDASRGPNSPVYEDEDKIAVTDLEDNEKFDAPVFTEIFASSIRSSQKSGASIVEYHAALAVDGDWTTAWCEGAPGPGIGEWIELRAEEPQHVSGIRILNGFFRSEERYYRNNAISLLKVVTDEGEASYSLALSTEGFQEIIFETPVNTKRIRLVIEDVYLAMDNNPPGSDNEDTLISEIEVF